MSAQCIFSILSVRTVIKQSWTITFYITAIFRTNTGGLITFNHCTLSCLFFLTCTEHILVFNWTQRWSVPGSYLALPDRAKEQGLYPRLLPSFFYSPCSRSSSLAKIWPRYLNGPGYDNGLLSQTFYQLYMCYRDNSIVIRSSPSIISEVGRPFSA